MGRERERSVALRGTFTARVWEHAPGDVAIRAAVFSRSERLAQWQGRLEFMDPHVIPPREPERAAAFVSPGFGPFGGATEAEDEIPAPIVSLAQVAVLAARKGIAHEATTLNPSEPWRLSYPHETWVEAKGATRDLNDRRRRSRRRPPPENGSMMRRGTATERTAVPRHR